MKILKDFEFEKEPGIGDEWWVKKVKYIKDNYEIWFSPKIKIFQVRECFDLEKYRYRHLGQFEISSNHWRNLTKGYQDCLQTIKTKQHENQKLLDGLER